MSLTYRVSATVNTENEAEAIKAALELLDVKATVTECGPLGELLDKDDAAEVLRRTSVRS